MNTTIGQFGQFPAWDGGLSKHNGSSGSSGSSGLTRPTEEAIWAQGWDANLNGFIANLPDPRAYYCREVLEKAVIKAETVRNKAVLSGSSFNAGSTVGRGALGAQEYYQHDEAQRQYVKPEDTKYVATVDKAISKAIKCARKAGYQQLPDGQWVEKKILGYIGGDKTLVGNGGRAAVDMSRLAPFARHTIPVSSSGSGEEGGTGIDGRLQGKMGFAPASTIPWGWIILGSVAVGGGIYLMRRKKKKSA